VGATGDAVYSVRAAQGGGEPAWPRRRCVSLNLELAALLGPELYGAVSGIAGKRQYFLGEWLFGGSAYADPPDAAAYFDHFPDLIEALSQHGITVTELNRLRDEVLPEWVRDHAYRIADSRYPARTAQRWNT
jgi:hypothetical protein